MPSVVRQVEQHAYSTREVSYLVLGCRSESAESTNEAAITRLLVCLLAAFPANRALLDDNGTRNHPSAGTERLTKGAGVESYRDVVGCDLRAGKRPRSDTQMILDVWSGSKQTFRVGTDARMEVTDGEKVRLGVS